MATDQEMLDRIAKLSSAIEQQRSIRGGRGGGYIPRGVSRGRGGYGMPPTSAYRGRGGHMSLNNNVPVRPSNIYYPVNSNPYVRPPAPNTYIKPPVTTPTANHNRKLVLNGAPPSVPTYRLPPPAPLPQQKSQHRKLIINHKGNSTTNNTMVKSIDPMTGRKQVAIDGVDFVVKGKKLIRKDMFDSNTTKSSFMASNAPKVLVRRTLKSAKRRDKNKNMVIGKAPIILKRKKPISRSKGGNMVFQREPEGYVRQGRSGKSLVLNTQRRTLKKARYCGFFTRYGKCPNAGHCPFQHDPTRIAICPRFLQNRCKKAVCRLSHTPNQFNMPHCVHFQKGLCKNDPCMYIHVKVSADAPICKAFAMEGYCPKGFECQEKHVHVCPEFAETGKCSNANCRLPHVAKRTAEKNAAAMKTTGIIRLGSWVSPQYFHAQKMAKAEKRKAVEEAAAAKVWTRPVEQEQKVSKEEVREKEEKDGFVRLFDDSDDDDGWSQYERDSNASGQDIKSLRFNDDDDEDDAEEEDGNEEEEGEDEDEEGDDDEEMEENDSDDGDESDVEEVYEEVSDEDMSDEEQPITVNASA